MANAEELEKLRIDPERKGGRKTRRLVRYAAWGAIACALGGTLWAWPYLVPASVDMVPLKRINPEVETSTIVLSVTGYVIPHRRVELAPKIVARVQSIEADKGDRVTSGQVIVRLEDFEFRANFDRARAALDRAQARADELRAGSRPEEIEAARADAELAEAQRDDAQRTVRRLEPLVRQGVENQQALDTAQTQVLVALARVNAARKRFEVIRIGPRTEEIRAAGADVAEARANLETAAIQLRECQIRAPGNGTILERLVEVGELVTNQNFGGRGARGSLLSLADLGDMRVEIDLNQSDLARVSLNQPCTISLEAYPDREYRGEVRQIAPEANRQKATVQVKVAILEPDERVRPELNARVSFLKLLERRPGEKQKAQVFAPTSAVVERDGRPTVFVVANGRARARKVSRGMEGINGVEILEGLTGDERILAKPPDGLGDGAAVRDRAK